MFRLSQLPPAWRWLVNGLVVAILVAALHHFWGLERLLQPWQRVSGYALVIVVLAQLASYSLRALRIYLADARIPKSQWLTCLQLILINNALNLLLPARTGEASFPVLLQRYFGVPLAEGTGTLLWLRMLDLLVLLILGLLVWVPLLTHIAFWQCAIASLLVGVSTLAAPMIARALTRLAERKPGRVWSMLAQVLSGIPKHPRLVALDLLLTFSAWSIKLFALGVVYAALAQISLSAGVLGAIGGDLSTVLPIHTPGGFGTYEAGVLALTASVVPASPQLLAAAINLHLIVLGIALGAGLLAWLCPNNVRK